MTDITLTENSGVILDQNRLRLPDGLEEQIKKQYTKILRVSKTEGLEQRIGDDKLGEFCKKEELDLITCDNTAHLEFFDAGIKKVQCERILKVDNAPHIYRLHIIE
jgi:hypothetical protein